MRYLLNEALDFRASHQHTVLSDLAVEICISLAELGRFKNLTAEILPSQFAIIVYVYLRDHAFLIRLIRNCVKCRLEGGEERCTLAVPEVG